MGNRIRGAVVIFTSTSIFMLASGNIVNAAPGETAEKFVENVAKQVVDTIKNPQFNDKQRLKQFGRIFDFAIDSPLIARIAAGRHLRGSEFTGCRTEAAKILHAADGTLQNSENHYVTAGNAQKPGGQNREGGAQGNLSAAHGEPAPYPIASAMMLR